MLRMSAEFNFNVLGLGKPQRGFASLFTTADCISYHTVPVCTSIKQSRTDEQGVCPGYDDDEEAPVGCSVIRDILVNVGVIHQ